MDKISGVYRSLPLIVVDLIVVNPSSHCNRLHGKKDNSFLVFNILILCLPEILFYLFFIFNAMD